MFRDAKLVQKLILGYKMDASLFFSKISFELCKTDVLERFSEVKLQRQCKNQRPRAEKEISPKNNLINLIIWQPQTLLSV